MNVLAITCHPDDAEIECGGTLIKCAKRGDKVILCHVSNGSLGSVTIPPEELAPMRKQEAKNSGALAGIEVICADFSDLDIYDNNKEAREKIIDVIRYAQPDFIITQFYDDYMPDHTAVSRLVFDASFAATLPNYTNYPHKFSSPDGPPAKLVPIYYMEPSGGLGFIPTEFVDITDEIELKLKMLACHESQIGWLVEHDDNDVISNTRIHAADRGHQCGVRYAEGFRQCNVYLKNTTRRMLP